MLVQVACFNRYANLVYKGGLHYINSKLNFTKMSSNKYSPNDYNQATSSSVKKCGNRTMDNGTVKKVCWNYSTKIDQFAEIRALPGKKKEFSNIKSKIPQRPLFKINVKSKSTITKESAKVSGSVFDNKFYDDDEEGKKFRELRKLFDVPKKSLPSPSRVTHITLSKNKIVIDNVDSANKIVNDNVGSVYIGRFPPKGTNCVPIGKGKDKLCTFKGGGKQSIS